MIQENKKKLKKLEVMHLEKMKFQEVCFESPFCWLQYSENCATILCMYWSQSCSNVKMRSSLELYCGMAHIIRVLIHGYASKVCFSLLNLLNFLRM